MKTTIYQKFIARYGETFTLVSIDYGEDELIEIVPHATAQAILKESVADFSKLVAELQFWQNEKASWEE